MSRLRALQRQWNELVPAAQAAGLRGVRTVRLYPEGLHERISHRQRRLDWLRRVLGVGTVVVDGDGNIISQHGQGSGGSGGFAVPQDFNLSPAQERALQQQYTRATRTAPRTRRRTAPSFVTAFDLAASEPVRVESFASVNPSAPFTFGVEIEFLAPDGSSRHQIADRLRQAGIEAHDEMYNHSVRRHWKIVTDGSLNNANHGFELVSPVLTGEADLAVVKKACEVLQAFGCRINKNCGLHVHIGARGQRIDFFKNLVRMYAQAEPIIDTFLAPSRRGNTNMFCRPVIVIDRDLELAANIDAVARAMGQTAGRRDPTRYCKLNLQSYWQHGTVEFRQHQGTIDGQKAVSWVRFCLLMANAARSNVSTTAADTVEALLAILGANETETQYFMSRVAFFARAEAQAARRRA